MFWILKEYRETSNVSWKVRGRTPKVSDDNFRSKIVEFQKNQARSILRNDIQKIITDELTATAEKNNISTLSILDPSGRTISNYLRFAQAKHRNISVRENIQTKSSTRFTAERSLRNVAAYLAIIAATHYMIGPPDPRVKTIEEAIEGQQHKHVTLVQNFEP